MPGMHGSVAANRAISQCDVLIGVGMRFDDRVTGKTSRFAKNAKIIHVDLDSAEHSKLIPAYLPILADSAAALEAMAAKMTKLETPEWWANLEDWKARKPKRDEWGAASAIKTISNALTKDDIVVADVGQHQMLTAFLKALAIFVQILILRLVYLQMMTFDRTDQVMPSLWIKN